MWFSEGETTEFKAMYVEDIKKEIIAFANTYGGTIYIGVEDSAEVCGVEDADAVIRQVSNAARDAIKPDVTLFLRYRVLDIEDKKVVEIKVQCGTHRPYYLAGKGLRPEGVYVRQGTSCVPASDAAIRRMIKETDGDNYEDMRSLLQELTFEKAEEFFKQRGIAFGEPQMRSLGFTDPEGQYRNLALLLSDQCPHIIKAAAFDGTDGQHFQDRREFTGSLLKQMEDAYAYMQLNNHTQAVFEGLLRIDHKDYPETALRESLLNAIVHRDYAISAETLISIYSDRIEIISIGGLAGGISYEDMMLGVSYCRNKKLANVFYRLNLIESYGTGMGKIMGAYRKSGIVPKVLVTSGAFKMVLPNQNRSAANLTPIETNGKPGRLLSLFRERKQMSRAEAEAALGVSVSTARRLLDALIREEKIRRVRQGKNVVYVLNESED